MLPNLLQQFECLISHQTMQCHHHRWHKNHLLAILPVSGPSHRIKAKPIFFGDSIKGSRSNTSVFHPLVLYSRKTRNVLPPNPPHRIIDILLSLSVSGLALLLDFKYATHTLYLKECHAYACRLIYIYI